MSTQAEPARPSHAELLEMLKAPDLTRRERRELQRMARFQRRVELWELRRATPHPRRLHRALVTLLMMAACLGVLWLLLFGNTIG
jgi:ferric-dicitrate binding protein FerR (iron transport regulator)